MSAPPAAPAKSQVTIYEDTSWERMFSSEVGRLIGYARPWITLGVLFGAGYVTHRLWGHMPAVPWAASGFVVAAVGLGCFTWALSGLAVIGRAHSAATIAALLVWLNIATITGPGQSVTGGLFGIIGGTVAASWNVRASARRKLTAAAADGGGNPAGRLSEWFRDAAKEAGITPAKVRVTELGPARAEAVAVLPPGKVHADLQAKVAAIESAGKVPPGAITTTADPDRADLANIVLSDPRVLTSAIPWPGPSAPGASIAHPLRPGIWQDGEPVMYVIVGHHIFAMGASGSGKSFGGCWNLLGEIFTRPDACAIGVDIRKGEQTFGPMRPALHRVETTVKGARSAVDDVESILTPRTNWLTERGLQKWETGCGLSYLFFWMEETPDIWEKLTSPGQDKLISIARALRSGGGTLVFSVQRNTWDQVPTIIRDQMASMCFGLNDAGSNRYGLSTAQQDAGVDPSEWGTRYPGKAVLDAPTIPLDRIAMPLRTYSWGDNADLMAAHAAAYPISARPVDPITAQIVGGPAAPAAPATAAVPAAPAPRPVAVLTRASGDEHQGDNPAADDDDEGPGDPCAEYLTIPDPSPDISEDITDADAPIEPDPDDAEFEFTGTAEKMTPDDARAEFARQLADWAAEGRAEFAPRDLRDLMDRTGMSRAWVQARLKDACETDNPPIERDDNGGVYRLLSPRRAA